MAGSRTLTFSGTYWEFAGGTAPTISTADSMWIAWITSSVHPLQFTLSSLSLFQPHHEPFVKHAAGSLWRAMTRPLQVCMLRMFSCNVWNGSGSARNIVNGIDLENEGGMVWYKARTSTSYNHDLYDTERGAGKYIHTNLDNKRIQTLLAFLLLMTMDFLRRQLKREWQQSKICWLDVSQGPRFFDVVTYPGQAQRKISHSLGSVPGAIWIKCTSASGSNLGCLPSHVEYNGRKELTFRNPDLGLQSDSTVFDSTEATSSVHWN